MEEKAGGNFRCNLLSKVGLDREGLDHKKKVEQLLAEPVVSREKLAAFGLKYVVPPAAWIRFWKLVLGVGALHQGARDFVELKSRQTYELLFRSLATMRKTQRQLSGPQIPSRLPTTVAELHAHLDEPPAPEDLLKMSLLEENRLSLRDDEQIRDPAFAAFLAIARRCLVICEANYQDAYAISKALDAYLGGLLPPRSLPDCALSLGDLSRQHRLRLLAVRHSLYDSLAHELRRLLGQGETADLAQRLDDARLWRHVPLRDWFRSGLAQVFAPQALSKLWNTLISGSYLCMVYVVLELLRCVQDELLGLAQRPSPSDVDKDEPGLSPPEALTAHCQRLPLSTQKHVIYRGLDVWSKESGGMWPKSATESVREETRVWEATLASAHQTSLRRQHSNISATSHPHSSLPSLTDQQGSSDVS